MKKWMSIVIIAIIFVATILLAIILNTPTVKYVSVDHFNKVVEELNTKVTDMQTEINTLISVNVDLQEEVEVAKNNNVSLVKEISNIKKVINNNFSILSNKVSKIEATTIKLQNWDKTYLDATMKGYNYAGIYRYMNNYMKTQ